MSTLQRLTDRGLIRPPRWLPNAVQYETIMGSVAYGVSSDSSDMDVYGWAIPPRDDVFPHLRGEIPGFGTPRPQFQQYQEHHVEDHDALGGRGRTYDLTIYGIVKFFNLAMQNNPNIIDSLFTPVNCVLHSTRVGDIGAREPQALPAQGGLVEVQELRIFAVAQALDQGRPGESGRARGRARVRYQVRLPRRPPDPGGRADPDRGGHRPPARQRAAQGDPAGRLDRRLPARVVLRQAVGAGEGVRREQAPARAGRGANPFAARSTAWKSTTAGWRTAWSSPTGPWRPCATSRPSWRE